MTDLRLFRGETRDDLMDFLSQDSFTLKDLLSKAATFFDGGGGILCPILGHMRHLVRTCLLESKVENDNQVNWEFETPNLIKQEFCQLVLEAKKLSTFTFPRCQIKGTVSSKIGNLMCFCDSADFETSLVYISFQLEDGTYSCSLVTAKSFLIKPNTSVAKSELSAH